MTVHPSIHRPNLLNVRVNVSEFHSDCLCHALNVPETESAAWITAFEFLQTQRLAVQIGEAMINGNPNAIDINQLNSVDRSILKESLLKVRSLQQHLQLDYVR
jgi:CBS domain-containing protein